MRITTADEMRLLDGKTIGECGIPGAVLMENAGRGAAALAADRFGPLDGKRVDILCGRGNNGGDGFVIGRVFHGWGARVRFYLLADPERVAGDARLNLEIAVRMGLPIVEIPGENRLPALDLSTSELIVDALLGTGLTSELTGHYRAAVERINATPARVLAVDIPSGVCSDTGRILGAAVRADLTATFGLPKLGLILPPGADRAGTVEVVDIGIPPHILDAYGPRRELIAAETLAGLYPARRRNAHKGDFGHVLIMAGSTGKTGAAALCALAAGRTGAGLVTAAVPASLNPILEEKLTEAMTEPLPEEMAGFVSAEAADRVLDLASGKQALALGPGLGARPDARRAVRRLASEARLPLVIDADGLNCLAGDLETLQRDDLQAVLTPHPGEMARLLGISTRDIERDRLAAAEMLAGRTGAVVVLKGWRTVVAAPDGRLGINTTGGPHMASGGMGDVLTGIVAGLLSQGLAPFDAARLGVFAHGLAADRASRGPAGLLAGDLLTELPAIWAELTA